MTTIARLATASTLTLIAAAGIGFAASQADEPAPDRMAEYIIEPPDVLAVEALDALPGRPIKGGFRVRPDGKITLSYYGEVHVAGLTVPQAKERIVRQLRKQLADDVLGLVHEPGVVDPGANPSVVPVVPASIRDTKKVVVDVLQYNSKGYYVLGAVGAPGKLPITGNETVLDALQYAGGLLADADPSSLTLVRDAEDGAPARKWTIDLDRITSGADPSMNHRLRSGDRLIASPKRRDENALEPKPHARPQPADPREPTPADLARRLDRIEALLEKMARGLGE